MGRKAKHEEEEDEEPEERQESEEDKSLDDDDMPLDAADSGALTSSLASVDDDGFDEDDFDDDFDDDFEQELDDELNEDLGEFDEKIEGEDGDDVSFDEDEDF